MLQQLLQVVHEGKLHNQFEIARKIGVTPALVLQMAQDLTTKGYLKGTVDECRTETQVCSGCPVNHTCQSRVNYWVLTEKGMKVLTE
jgi:hypothetical protein